MNKKTLPVMMIGLVLLVACASPTTQAPPAPTLPSLATATPTLSVTTQTVFPLTLTPEAVTPLPGVTRVSHTSSISICNDAQATALIDSFKTAILTSDGPLLSSLVSPTRGMDVAFFRDGTVITYN